MKKLVCGFIGSFMIMFFIWTIIGWINEPNFIENASHYHLNLYAMLQRFNTGSISTDFISTFRSLINSLKTVNNNSPIIKSVTNTFVSGGYSVGSAFTIILSVLNAIINPLYMIANVTLLTGYLLVLVVQFLGITTAIAGAIFMFVFEPIFTYV